MGFSQCSAYRAAALCAAVLLSFPSFAAASSVGVERTLGDLAGRMGLGALPPSEVPAVGRVLIANRAPASELGRVWNWLLKEGRSISDQGRPLSISAALAAGLGMDAVVWPITQKTFGPVDRPEITCHLQIAELNGRREYIIRRKEGDETVLWRATLDGRLLNTAVLVTGKSYGPVANDLHRDLLGRMIDGLLEMVPSSRVD